MINAYGKSHVQVPFQLQQPDSARRPCNGRIGSHRRMNGSSPASAVARTPFGRNV